MKRERLDEALVRLQIADTVEKARALIMEGRVFQNGQRLDKPALPLKTDAGLVVKGDKIPYVSRGGLKLERAIRAFALDLSGLTCLDVGSSTGGFTDCMLQNGARRVFSVDVGYGLLDWKLRNDPRVTVLERVNARNLSPELLGGCAADFASMDVSFISVRTVLPAVRTCVREGAHLAVLVKPQFEARREQVGKGGIVRDPQVHREVLLGVIAAAPGHGLCAAGPCGFAHPRRGGERRVPPAPARRRGGALRRRGRGRNGAPGRRFCIKLQKALYILKFSCIL